MTARFHRGPRRVARSAVSAFGIVLLASTGLRAQPFTQVASPDIAAHVAFSTGASWIDYDMDGWLDIFVVCGFSANNANVLYHNNGDGTFTRVLGVPLVQDAAESVCSTWADYDNDGDIDCFVSNLVNQGGMLYTGHPGTDLTLETNAGIGGVGLKGTGAAWGDYDNDGFVDLVIAALFGQAGITTPNRLFHGDGDGTFTEITTGPQVTTFDSHHHPTWSDYDGDGDLDLFFATGGPGFVKFDRMYRNRLIETGTATFEAITTGIIATDARDSQVLSWVDYDNDGRLDLYAVNYSSVPNQLYHNNGGGSFTKILGSPIVTDAGAAHGVVWGDFDNDGDQDAYVARDLSQSNRFYRNDGGGTFTSITTGPFVNEGRSNYGAAAGDYDRDGDLDLFLPTARSEGPSQLFRNDLANGNHWVVVRCQGTVSNRSGIGAKVRVRATIGGTPRWQLREILAGTSYGGHGPLEAHFGLGDAGGVDSVRVEWPSGLVEVRTDVAMNAVTTIVENSTTPVVGALMHATATQDGAEIEWSLPGWSGREVAVQRADATGMWSEVGRVTVEPRGRLHWRDAAVRPGDRYGYRLELAGASGPQWVGETWIEIPLALAFGIDRVWPNPCRGMTQVQLDLSSGAAAAIELYDVAGHQVGRFPVTAAVAGRHLLGLDLGSKLSGGVYFARLRQGARVDTARIVIEK